MTGKEKLGSELNVIIADTDWHTFEILSELTKQFNLINLSSDFAVNFILDYERVDVVIISKKISGKEEILIKAKKKKANIYVLGKDLKYPADIDEIRGILEKEKAVRDRDFKLKEGRSIGKYFKKLFSSGTNPSTKIDEPDDYWDRVAGKDLFESEKNISGDNLLELEKESVEGNLSESEKNIDMDFWGSDKNESKYKIPANEKDADLFKNTGYKNTLESPVSKNTVAIKQKIIVFTKAKGGVGSTLLSLFLGYEFRKLKTLLIDLNFSEGGSDLGYYLNIPKVPNIIIFTEGYNRAAIDNSVINIKDSLDLIQSPPTYELSRKLDLQDIYSLVDIARRKYHLIIFDLPNMINDIYLGVLDMADLILMISDFTLGSVGRLISINNRFIYNDMEKILVMNRAKNGNGFVFTKNQLKDLFNLKELVILNENEMLSGRTDFTNLNFSNLKEFTNLTTKVLELLTCD